MTCINSFGQPQNNIQKVFLPRLVNELEILVEKSLELQAGLHTLDLSQSARETRKTLQSADTLSQTLVCLKVALEGLIQTGNGDCDFLDFGSLDGIFLEDVRERLLHGKIKKDRKFVIPAGVVDIF